MSAIFPLLFSLFPGTFGAFLLGVLALLLLIITFRVIRMVLDAIPFL